jgi:hypothetical protein
MTPIAMAKAMVSLINKPLRVGSSGERRPTPVWVGDFAVVTAQGSLAAGKTTKIKHKG